MSDPTTIGASEIAAVLGVDPWTTPQQLWERKRGLTVFEGNEATRRGQYFEPALCAWWLDLAKGERNEQMQLRSGCRMVNGQLQVRHPVHTFARATPDMVATCVPVRWPNGAQLDPRNDRCVLAVDVKNPASQSVPQVGGGWRKIWDDATQTAPLQYRCQSMYQVGVLQAAGVSVVAGELAAGPFFGKLIRVLVEPDPEWFALALERAEEFLTYVKSGEPLPPSFSTQTEGSAAHV